jgi:hypothetical protein
VGTRMYAKLGFKLAASLLETVVCVLLVCYGIQIHKEEMEEQSSHTNVSS